MLITRKSLSSFRWVAFKEFVYFFPYEHGCFLLFACTVPILLTSNFNRVSPKRVSMFRPLNRPSVVVCISYLFFYFSNKGLRRQVFFNFYVFYVCSSGVVTLTWLFCNFNAPPFDLSAKQFDRNSFGTSVHSHDDISQFSVRKTLQLPSLKCTEIEIEIVVQP